jgi:hypothetical protein
MRSTLTSRNFNRALPWLAGLVLVLGVAIYFQSRTETGRAPQVFEAGEVQDRSRTPRSVPMPAAARRAAVTFLRTAVAREDLATAWTVAGPNVRGGQSREEWLKEIGVVPYPGESMDKAPIRVDWSYPRNVGLSIALLPKRGSGEKPQVFQMELRRLGAAKRWVVDSWVPYAPPVVRDSLNQ